jgi:hypothetical protein
MVWLHTNDTRVVVPVVALKQHGVAVGAIMMKSSPLSGSLLGDIIGLGC